MKKTRPALSKYFLPDSYELRINNGRAQLTIQGRKLPPPNSRFSLRQNKLKVKKAQVIKMGKTGPTELTIKRINHLPTFEEVRIHTFEKLFPGQYKIILEYDLTPGQLVEISKFNQGLPPPHLMPSVGNFTASSQSFKLIYDND